jgi:hypothetical protein
LEALLEAFDALRTRGIFEKEWEQSDIQISEAIRRWYQEQTAAQKAGR